MYISFLDLLHRSGNLLQQQLWTTLMFLKVKLTKFPHIFWIIKLFLNCGCKTGTTFFSFDSIYTILLKFALQEMVGSGQTKRVATWTPEICSLEKICLRSWAEEEGYITLWLSHQRSQTPSLGKSSHFKPYWLFFKVNKQIMFSNNIRTQKYFTKKKRECEDCNWWGISLPLSQPMSFFMVFSLPVPLRRGSESG